MQKKKKNMLMKENNILELNKNKNLDLIKINNSINICNMLEMKKSIKFQILFRSVFVLKPMSVITILLERPKIKFRMVVYNSFNQKIAEKTIKLS